MQCEYCNTEHPADQISNPHYCIARMGEEIEKKDATITQQAEYNAMELARIAEKDKEIAELKSCMNLFGEDPSWCSLLIDRCAEITALQEDLIIYRDLSVALQKMVNSKDARIKELEDELFAARQAILTEGLARVSHVGGGGGNKGVAEKAAKGGRL